VFTDITEEKRRRMELESAAYYDTLTGTYSRLFGMNTLEEWLARKQHFVLAFVDMDNLKYVNDTFGHNEGDAYILHVTQMLRSFDHRAIISRLGGDEFMILAPDWTKEEANTKLEAIREMLVGESTEQYNRSISYGVREVCPDNRHPSSLILSLADEIMYEYKRSRKMERRTSAL
jgi:diguanylate cyclase (GGDEF)-like protein